MSGEISHLVKGLYNGSRVESSRKLHALYHSGKSKEVASTLARCLEDPNKQREASRVLARLGASRTTVDSLLRHIGSHVARPYVRRIIVDDYGSDARTYLNPDHWGAHRRHVNRIKERLVGRMMAERERYHVGRNGSRKH